MASKLAEIFRKHATYQDLVIDGYTKELKSIAYHARRNMTADLMGRLTVDTGRIEKTEHNARILRTLDQRFVTQMNRAGYRALTEEFVDQFGKQQVFMDDILRTITSRMKTPLVEVTKRARVVGELYQRSATRVLASTLDSVAASITKRALFSVGGLDVAGMTEVLIERFGVTVSEATTLAETLQQTYFRTVMAEQFAELEEQNGRLRVRYYYDGIRDDKNRLFCVKELNRERPLTRRQIERLDNGQLPNPFLTCGGYNCRHQWLPSAESLAEAA